MREYANAQNKNLTNIVYIYMGKLWKYFNIFSPTQNKLKQMILY